MINYLMEREDKSKVDTQNGIKADTIIKGRLCIRRKSLLYKISISLVIDASMATALVGLTKEPFKMLSSYLTSKGDDMV